MPTLTALAIVDLVLVVAVAVPTASTNWLKIKPATDDNTHTVTSRPRLTPSHRNQRSPLKIISIIPVLQPNGPPEPPQ